ncbi:MAG: FAD-dependent oxidoreductase, partial [Spirochaetes bacterium]|nr:FAD-dependent oxidoreductase [Spirochaetota bacterium]
ELVMKHTGAGLSCGTCQNRIESIIENTYDVIIVGAGLGGLTTGATLAKEGKKVLILEKHDKVGGYATAFTREGFKFDASLHNLGPLNSTMKIIFNELELNKKLNFIPYDSFQHIIFPEHDFDIPAGDNQFTDLLINFFPEEKEGIIELFKETKYVRKGFEEFEELSISGNPDKMNNPMMAVKYPQFVELVEKTLTDFLDTYIKNEQLKGLIANFWWYIGLPTNQMASLIYLVTFINYFENAGGYIEGTSQNLSDSLADIIQGNHGRVILNTEVTKILVADNQAHGILTDQGEVFYANMVISNANAKDTFTRLIDKEHVKKRVRRKVNNLEYSLSVIQLYLGLDCDPEQLGFKDHCFSVFSDYDHQRNFQLILEGDYENSFFSCTNYTKIDKNSTPEGKGIMTIISMDHIQNWEGLSEHEYHKKKEEVTNILIKKAEKYLPGLSNHIEVKELGTPKTMERYTFNPDGSIYGPSHIPDQSGMRRLPTYTSTKGLFIVGSTIYPGGGYPSVIGSGYKTAKMILFAEQKQKEEENQKVE